MSKTLEKWKGTRTYGLCLLLAMLLFFYLIFKILTPQNFGSPSNLYSYLQSSIIYSVGGCGLYFIVVMPRLRHADRLSDRHDLQQSERPVDDRHGRPDADL